MEKKVVNLESLTDNELLQEFADRVMAYEKSLMELHQVELERAKSEGTNDTVMDALGYVPDYCGTEEVDEEEEERYNELKMENDNDFCRVREIVRFVKKDDTIWEC